MTEQDNNNANNSNNENNNSPTCRICYMGAGEDSPSGSDPLVTDFCECKGSLAFIHKDCLQQVLASSGYTRTNCDLCTKPYHLRIEKTFKPVTQWRLPPFPQRADVVTLVAIPSLLAISIICIFGAMSVSLQDSPEVIVDCGSMTNSTGQNETTTMTTTTVANVTTVPETTTVDYNLSIRENQTNETSDGRATNDDGGSARVSVARLSLSVIDVLAIVINCYLFYRYHWPSFKRVSKRQYGEFCKTNAAFRVVLVKKCEPTVTFTAAENEQAEGNVQVDV